MIRLLALAAALALAGCASSGPKEIAITVTDSGFEPKEVRIPKGQPAVVVITRKTDRTCATEAVFADMMRAPETGFDAMHAGNVSPLVVWLASADAGDVTGRVFEIEGGAISVADGWQHGAPIDRGERWPVGEVGGAVRELLAKAPQPAPVYGS